ncbi:hypothetical protein MGL_3922 [Malassezia globosa CBS 7966]|uniref:NADH dehydrogenase [ubiquinone] iron-sulfur protein 5 n=1 Tax=Malassezia globosa (strain ATCC MYA-4612 / CBS 7966) TaxID=425265 RepID=A8QBL8_MALGO|nr:uncharacterized protein MGL_3922 [Malassezia globosa CBS 7966]EDP41714.1 hypothetical protein MGL_3922 [Malassezia globosa CBS 7966]
MASGFGVNGGPSRCFSFWQDFRKCYVSSESPAECSLLRDDYLECLHHTKELERANKIQNRMIEVQHQESKRARDIAKAGGDNALRLGFIDVNESPKDTPQESQV